MTTRTTMTIALAVLVFGAALTGAVAAGGHGDAPNHAPTDGEGPAHAGDGERASGSAGANVSANASDSANDHPRADARGEHEVGVNASGDATLGPAVDLPSQVPAHVAEIHATIGGYLDGTIDHLGAAVSAIASSEGGEARANASDGDGVEADVPVSVGSSADAGERGADGNASARVDVDAERSSNGGGISVSAHVAEIHATIDGFLDGAIDSLGVAVSAR